MPVTDDRSPMMAADSRERWLHTTAMPATWAYRRRLFPLTTFLTFAAVCSAWAVASELDSPIEATVLTILGSVPLAIVFFDAAAAVTAPSVVPLAWRRVVPALIGMGLATAGWLVARCVVAALGSAPWPDRWALLEWSTVALSQVAVAAFRSNRRPASTSFGPGILLALVWYIVAAEPRLHQLLFDPPEHMFRWLGLATIFIAVTRVASPDPAHRRRSGTL